MTAKRILAVLIFMLVAVSVSVVDAQQSADPRVADIIQAGRLRVALGLGSPVLALKDPNSGEVRGPALDLARALAKKIGVRLEPVEYPRPGAILAGVKNNEWDVTFLVADPARLADADFSLHICKAILHIWCRLALRSAQPLRWINRALASQSHGATHPISA